MLQATMPSNLPPGGDPFEGSAYRWVRQLGGGGMGEVHLVEHRALGVEFVAKVLHKKYAEHAQLTDRLRVEAQSLAKLEHPNIVQVTGFSHLQDGRPFIVMEPLSGHTLESEVQGRGRLPVVEAVRYGLQLASALAAAHAIGIVHRDIKPDNLFLHHDHDGTKMLKVLDFGVARILPGVSDQSPVPLAVPTDTGIVVGTPRYVSPEAAIGRRVDHRADIYGAGLVLYIMLTGSGPFDHIRGERGVLAAHVNDPPRPISTFGIEGVSQELQAIVSHALAKNPDNRLSTAKELEARLAHLLAQVASAQRRASQPPAPLNERTLELAVPSPAGAPARAGGAPSAPAPAAAARASQEPVRAEPLAPTLLAVQSPPTRVSGQPPASPAAQPIQASAVRSSSAPIVSPSPGLGDNETPAPIAPSPAKRSPAVLAAVFVAVALLVGLASAGAVTVLRRLLGAP